MTETAEAPLSVVLPVAEWPPADQAAWNAASARRQSPFRKNGGGRSLNYFTVRMMRSGYGRWLGFLRDSNQLDPDEAAAHRLTLDRLDAYFLHLQVDGNGDFTIVCRFDSLRDALELMYPGLDCRWVNRPQGVGLRNYLLMQRRDRITIPSGVLAEWAGEVFAAGLAHHKPRCRRALVREAAIIGVLVMPAPRLRTLTALTLDKHMQRRDDGWYIHISAGITKTSHAEWCPLLTRITPILDRYVSVERLELLENRLGDRLWIAQGGGDLAQDSISRRIRIRSLFRFGRPFGPHFFRTCLATTNAMDGYMSPLDSSVLLGHSNSQTTNQSYNRANASAAAARHADRLKRLRSE